MYSYRPAKVLAGLATASDLNLGDRIVATEQECDRIYNLSKNIPEQAAFYLELFLTCLDSLNEDKYAYIDEKKINIRLIPKDDNKFPIDTSEGVKLVTEPPLRDPKEELSMKKRLSKYLTKSGGMINSIYGMLQIQDTLSQIVIDKLVECDTIGLHVLQNPDDGDSKTKHTDCVNKLNCIKQYFMDQHLYARKDFPEFFPILYKRRGTMVKTPPEFDKSVCETSDLPTENNKTFEDWMNGAEFIGSKLTDVGAAGADLVQKLIKKALGGGGEKALTEDELENLMADGDPNDDEKDDEGEQSVYGVYKDILMDKLASIPIQGVEFAHAELEKVEPAIKNIASKTGENLDTIKEHSKNALEELKGGLTLAKIATKIAASQLTQQGSNIMNKMMANSEEEKNGSETNETDRHKEDETFGLHGVLKSLIGHITQTDYLPQSYNDNQPSNILQIIKDLARHGGNNNEGISTDEVKKTLDDLKEKTRQKAEELHLSQEEIKQSADVVKGVMHALLSTAGAGFGGSDEATQKDVEKARSIVDELVNYATAEISNKGYATEEDDEGKDVPKIEGSAVIPKGSAEGKDVPKGSAEGKDVPKSSTSEGLTQAQEEKKPTSDKVPRDTKSTANKETMQKTVKTGVVDGSSKTDSPI